MISAWWLVLLIPPAVLSLMVLIAMHGVGVVAREEDDEV